MRSELAGEVAVGAGAVLHHDGLAEPYAQGLAQRAGDEIGGAAGRERHEKPDRPGRIGLARRGAREHRKRRKHRKQRGKRATAQTRYNGTHATKGPWHPPILVIAGLDPAIHPLRKNLLAKKMDARVISAFTRVFDALLPAHDDVKINRRPY